MELIRLIAFACTVLAAYAQFCPPTDVLLLLDQSENALRASSTDRDNAPFDILKSAVRDFLNNPRVRQAGSNFKIGAYGYSSSAEQITIFNPGSSPSSALNSINQIGTGTNAGSWTYRGLEMVQRGPLYPNNLIIVVSSQGSGSTSRRTRSQMEINRVRTLGWNVYVVAMQGLNNIDYDELSSINGGNRPKTLVDTTPTDATDPKPYKLLSSEFTYIINNLLCTEVPATTPTTTTTTTTTTQRPRVVTTRRTTPRVYGLCSECLFEGGYGFDFDPEYCDTFYQCLPDTEPIKKQCPSGTFWDGAQCNFIDAVNCPLAVCDPSTPSNTRYPSGRCCNKYYECSEGELKETVCPADRTFDANSGDCVIPSNRTEECAGTGRWYCDVNTQGPIDVNACAGYAPDPFGDPCKFQFAGQSIRVAPGTVWNQDICSLDFTPVDLCLASNVSNDKVFGGEGGPADVCNAVFLATYDQGSRDVFSERLNTKLNVYSILQEASLADNGLSFSSALQDPFMYYFFFNNRDLLENTAFKLRFRLDNPELNVEYDLLSNNYCALCPETISFTVSATSNTRRVVSATFVTTFGNTVTTSAIIDKSNANEMVEMIVIFGDAAVYGEVYSLSGNSVSQTAEFNRVAKEAGANIAINRCGLQLGRGPNRNFVGMIDEFAVYEYCQDISSVLR